MRSETHPTLDYGRPPRMGIGAFFGRHWRVLLYGLSIPTAVVLFDLALQWRWHLSTCRQCAASSQTNSLRFFGVGGNYNESVSKGAISSFIEQQTGRPCGHDWEMASFRERGIFGVMGVGIGIHRLLVHRLEELTPDLDIRLQRWAANDPLFVSTLRAAIADPSSYANFWHTLSQELTEDVITKRESASAPGPAIK